MTSAVPRRAYGGKPAEQRRAERRERLLAAGLDLFGTGGYAAASVDRICEHAGLSTRQFYMEFANRDEVLLVLYDALNDRAEKAVDAAVTEAFGALPLGGDIRPLLRAALSAYIAEVASDPRWAQVAFTVVVGVTPEIEAYRLERRRRWVARLCLLAEEAAARDAVPSRDFRLTMTAFIGAVNGLVHDWSLTEPRAPREAIAETLAHLLSSALASAPGH